MGAGCSSPLRRLGGNKPGKSTRRNSSSAYEVGDEVACNEASKEDKTCRQQPTSSCQAKLINEPSEHNKTHKFILENENTIQSEINEDHPSTASYYTDGKNHLEEATKNSEQSTGLEPKSLTGNVTNTPSTDVNSLGNAGVAARLMGMNGGSYVLHDRHLLVSPALSPAPSTCYSPSPANSTLGTSGTMLDLNDLNEACKILTFGSPSNQPTSNWNQATALQQPKQRINYKHNLSEANNYYTQLLVQTQDEQTKYISVIFITSDNFHTASTNEGRSSLNVETLAEEIESNLKKICDVNQFNLRFLNLSYEHLSSQLHVNNLLAAGMKIFEQECIENNQRIIVIALSNITNGSLNANNDSSNIQQNLDKRQLPAKIEAQIMNQLQQEATENSDDASSLLKRWYNQVGNVHYLNPIYIPHPTILSGTDEERSEAWQNWLKESYQLIKLIDRNQDTNKESNRLKMKSLYNSCIDYILNEPFLQRRTLLIRNYSMDSSLMSNQSQQQSANNQVQSKDSNLNELARLLADPNKLNLKRSMDEGELSKTINDWISENFSKFVDTILENQIISGKQVPPFIEKSLFIELTSNRHRLEHYLDNVTETFESKCQNFYSSQILPILNGVQEGSNTNNTVTIAEPTTNDPQQRSSNHLVFISGPKGCGKSSLFAQIIKFTAQDFYNRAQIIYRFCGISLDSLAPDRLLRSICEQFCQTQGENITAASYIYSARKDVINSLNKIIKQQTSIIFIDGLNTFFEQNNHQPAELDLDWLCEIEPNPRVKFFITLETGSEYYKKALGSYTEATYISLDHPSITEWAQMFASTARSNRFNSATSLYDEIKNLNLNSNRMNESSETQKLNYKDLNDIIHMCRIRKLNNEVIYPELSNKIVQNNALENMKNIQQVILTHLHYLISPYKLCALFIIISSSRNGLSETDIINIMTRISQSKISHNNSDSNKKFSISLLDYLKIQLQPWLLYIICDKTVKVTMDRDFLNSSIDYYTSNMFKNAVEEIRETLIDYYAPSQSKTKGSATTSSKSDLVEQTGRLSSSELLWLSTQASEYLNLLLTTNPIKAKEHVLNKQHFFSQFLYNSMPEEFIEDFQSPKELQGKKNPNYSEELQCLVNYIRQSVYPLRYDGSQIYSQIYCRAIQVIKSGKGSKGKKLDDILKVASNPPVKSLLPVSETSVNSFIKTRIGLNEPDQSSITTSTSSSTISQNQPATNSATQRTSSSQPTVPNKQKIYTIKDNHRHVIVIYPDKGSLSVWDIFEEKPVRTISNLDQPRDLRMIDQKRAVILCNRELRVYDLDSGLFLNKLKGVMNQKMPFFEIFGENYVVALARNRMYVNMLNVNTGELETTFKVGEDRFLNSLLVSANGGVCVCGDETQKPFPLLVWNLNERRLMYDLRLDKHEFLTRMSAISDDGHFVVSVCKQIPDVDKNNSSGKGSPNFIIIYDLNSGTLFKKWKPGVDTCAVEISLSANRSGKVINCIVNNTILIWDLATGSKRHTLTGHTAPVDIIKVQNNRLFSMDSSCRDQSLRIWDIEEGYCMAVFSPDAPINCCQMSVRGDALVCGFAAESRLSTLVMCKNETVNDVVKRNKRRKSSKSLYIFDEPPVRKASS